MCSVSVSRSQRIQCSLKSRRSYFIKRYTQNTHVFIASRFKPLSARDIFALDVIAISGPLPVVDKEGVGIRFCDDRLCLSSCIRPPLSVQPTAQHDEWSAGLLLRGLRLPPTFVRPAFCGSVPSMNMLNTNVESTVLDRNHTMKGL